MARADCPICAGSGWKVVERTTEGAQALSADQPGTGSYGEPKMVWAVPCDFCTAEDRTERVFARARIPRRYRDCDFEGFRTDFAQNGYARAWIENLQQAKISLEGFAGKYHPGAAETGGPEGLGLLLMGPCGVGKTHLAVAALKGVVKRGFGGIFYDYRDLLKQIQDSYDPESQSTEMSVLKPVLKTEVLVLDDVGSSKPSAWALETVGHILNTRYNERRATIVTANYLDKELADCLRQQGSPRISLPSGEVIRSAEQDTLSDRVGVRIRSRLYEMCRTIEIVAPDYRKEIRNISRRA